MTRFSRACPAFLMTWSTPDPDGRQDPPSFYPTRFGSVILRTSAMKRINYIFIDYENVCPSDLGRIKGKCAQVHLVLGARQEKPAKRLHRQIEEHAEKVQMIKTPLAGKNALDFVLACEVGMQAVKDPKGYYHIISKDTGFDSLIKHLLSTGILAARHADLASVPALMTTEERFELLIARLKDPDRPRPAKRKTLASTIQATFDRALDSHVVDKTITLMIHKGILSISESDRVTYST
jgi:hypothetical protein